MTSLLLRVFFRARILLEFVHPNVTDKVKAALVKELRNDVSAARSDNGSGRLIVYEI